MSLNVNPAVRSTPATAPLQRPTGPAAKQTAPLVDPLGMGTDWLSMSGSPVAAPSSTADLVARVQAAQGQTNPIEQNRQTTLQNYDSMLGALRDRRRSLRRQLPDATPQERNQIRAQMAQLSETSNSLLQIRRELRRFQAPANASPNEQAVIARSIDRLDNLAKQLAGGTDARTTRVQAAQIFNQMANPGLDASTDPVLSNHSNAMTNLLNVQGRLADRMDQLSRQFEGADAMTKAQIHAQLGQLGRVMNQTEGMMRELQRYRRPSDLSPNEQAVAANALNQADNLVKQLAGATPAEMSQIRANFAQTMNQLRNPGLDVRRDPLFVNQHNASVNAANVQGRLMDRMDNLTRQMASADPRTAQQIQAQLAQIGRMYSNVEHLSSQLASYRPDPSLSGEARQSKARLMNQVDDTLKQLAGADAASAVRLMQQADQLFRALRA